MTEAKLKAKEMVDALGIDTARMKCKRYLYISFQMLGENPTEANSTAFQFWGDVMDELNEMEG